MWSVYAQNCWTAEPLTEPVVDPEIRQDVPHEQVHEAIVPANQEQDGTRDEQAQIGEPDQWLVLLLIQRTAGVEVVDATVAVLAPCTLAFWLLLVVIVASGVGEQVRRPAEQLLQNEVARSVDGCLFQQVVHLFQHHATASGMLFPGAWAEHHIPLEVAGGFVVLAVADLPAEVRDQQRRVAEPSYGVVQGLARRERLVAALMCQNPQTGTDTALNESVARPQTSSQGHRRYILWCAIRVEGVKCRAEHSDIPGHVAQTLHG